MGRGTTWICVPLLISLIFGPGRAPAVAKGIIIEVEAGTFDRQNTVVSFDLPEQIQSQKAFRLTEVDTNESVPVQVDADPPARVVWIIRDRLAAGQVRRYRLSPASSINTSTTSVTTKNDGKFIFVTIGKRTVLRYNEAVTPSSIPQKPEYRRSGYIHPVYDPDGRAITDDMAPDHAHQHGIMFPYEKTKFEGHALNFWEPSNGTISHDNTQSVVSGPIFGGFQVGLRHDENDLSGGPIPVLRENWKLRVYNFTDYFLFDLESVQNCATDSPLLVEKNAYGGLAIRCNRNWFDHPDESEYLTSDGNTRATGNQTRPVWADMYGAIAGKVSGVAILDHPSNFRFPQPVRLHPQKPYMCFAPMAAGSFSIEPAKPYFSRYRFYIHLGQPDAKRIEMLWHDYAEPPQVRLLNSD